MSNSIFDDTAIFTPERGTILKQKSRILNVLDDVIRSKIFDQKYIMKTLNVNHKEFELIAKGMIHKTSLEFLQSIEAPAKQLLEFVEYIQAKQKQTSTEQEVELA